MKRLACQLTGLISTCYDGSEVQEKIWREHSELAWVFKD